MIFEKWWTSQKFDGMLDMMKPMIRPVAEAAFKAGKDSAVREEKKQLPHSELMPDTSLDIEEMLRPKEDLTKKIRQQQREVVEKYGWQALEELTKTMKQKILIEKP